MKTHVLPAALLTVLLSLLLVACHENPFEADQVTVETLDFRQALTPQSSFISIGSENVRGRTIQNVQFGSAESGAFSGRINELRFIEAFVNRPSPLVFTTGKVIGWATDREGKRHRIEQEFGEWLFVWNVNGYESPPYVLDLENPREGIFTGILLDAYVLDIEVPSLIDVEISGSRGPSQMIGRELQTVLTDPDYHFDPF